MRLLLLWRENLHLVCVDVCAIELLLCPQNWCSKCILPEERNLKSRGEQVLYEQEIQQWRNGGAARNTYKNMMRLSNRYTMVTSPTIRHL